MTAVSYDFVETNEPPVDRRPGGRGRPRTNPFDDAVRKSYEERWSELVSEHAPTGKWFALPESVSKEEAQKLEQQIRSSAAHWSKTLDANVGSSVRWNPETGVLQFRGVEKSQGDDQASHGSGENDPAVSQDANNEGEDWEG